MALIGARSFAKYSQIMVDNLFLTIRPTTIGSLRKMNQNTITEKTTTDSTQNGGPPPTTEANARSEETQVLVKQIGELTEKNTELLDKYRRSLADGENLRTRMNKQIAEAKQFGIQGFCKDLLEVADVLGKATETVPTEEVSDRNPHLKSLYEGLVMTEAQLQAVFKRHGLEKVNPQDEKFNPNYHEALFQQEVQGKEAGTVVVVSKIGYKLHDRVIRPALVGVSK